MKVLYAIQGTGNGHVSRAMEVYPYLEKRAEVDYLVSGEQVDLDLPFELTYRAKGMSLYFGKRGGVDLSKTILKNTATRIWKEIKRLPVEKYDLVINDFEPISAWAARKKGVKCVALSHQSALRSSNIPRPDSRSFIGKTILQNYAPAQDHYGFHFARYTDDIFTPIIRSDLRGAQPQDKGHITVYLPAYDEKRLIKYFSKIPQVTWHVFSKHGKSKYITDNVSIFPIDREEFATSMLNAHGVLCGGGFETPSEALFLGKKLMVIPMKNQYEQLCNAEALQSLGVAVIPSLSKAHVERIQHWVNHDTPIQVNYPDETEEIVNMILDRANG
jgi:uncharacterized protein (TIGR00661 family)